MRVALCVLASVWAGLIVACGGGMPAPQSSLPPADMTVKAFRLQKPDEEVSVSGEIKMKTYYNFAFYDCAKSHYSFNLRDGSDNIDVYAPKSSEHGQKLYELLKGGGTRQAVIKVKRVGPDGQKLPAKDDSCFSLQGVVAIQ